MRSVPVEEPRPAAFLALNPIGTVPTLVDEQLVLSESHAIMRYLVRREGRPDLYGPTQAEAAHVDEWLDRLTTVLRPAFFRHESAALGYIRGSGFHPEQGDPAAALELAARIAPTLRTFDAPRRPRTGRCSDASRSPIARSRRCSTGRRTADST